MEKKTYFPISKFNEARACEGTGILFVVSLYMLFIQRKMSFSGEFLSEYDQPLTEVAGTCSFVPPLLSSL